MSNNHIPGVGGEAGFRSSVHEMYLRAKVALVAGATALTLGMGLSSIAAAQPDADRVAYDPLELAPTFEDPMALANGQFLGSVAFHYAHPNRGRQLIADYQRSRGIAWTPHKQTVNRLVASNVNGKVDNAEGGLDEGVVMYQSSQSNVLLFAHHNVTPIRAPLNVRGQRYDNRYIGSNAVAQRGDEMTITRPIAGTQKVRTYSYQAIDRKILKPTQIDAFVTQSTRFQNTNVNYAVTYSCWTPGTDTSRSLIVWRRVPNNGVDTLNGTVRPVGAVSGASGDIL